MNNISKVKTCYGCLSCVDKCPVNCISIKETALGHVIPNVNEDICINCGLCLSVCPDIKNMELRYPLKAVASWANSDECRDKSSSGALATVIAERFIESKGVVYGCAFTPPFGFSHIRCTSLDDLAKLRGSKYVQSDTQGVFKLIKDDIRRGLKVLFIGTPCQVAGVKNFIGKSDDLFTIDLICHGVPSIKLLKESIPVDVCNLSITNVEFRVNTKFHFSMKGEDGVSIVYERDLRDDLYLKAFFTGLDYRESCYKCQFAQSNRVGDLTLGDFWGVKINVQESEKEKGISLCLVNTDKGAFLLDDVKIETKQIVRPVEEAISGNHQLQHPKNKTFRSILFKMLYPFVGFKYAVISSIPEVYLKSRLFRGK